MRTRAWVAASMVAGIVVLSAAAPAQAAPGYPRADGRCVDETGVLGADLCRRVTAGLMRDEKATSDEIAVVVVPTTGDASIEQWSTGLFNTWGVGKKGKDNGVLLVVAKDDHKVRLEVGRGMDDRLDTDTIVADITGHFADDEYALGILTGLDEVRTGLGHTVAAGARLESLAASAPALPGSTDPGSTDPGSTDPGTTDSDVTGSDSDPAFSWDSGTSDDAEDSDSAPTTWLIVAGAFFAVLVIGFFVKSRSSSAGTGRNRDESTWPAGTAHGSGSSTSFISSSDSSSGSSGSSFGGGSSDGGGSTGSW